MKEKKVMGRPKKYSGDQKIIKLTTLPMGRPKSQVHENLKLIKNKMKVSTYEKKGGNLRYLRYAVERNWIEIQDVCS